MSVTQLPKEYNPQEVSDPNEWRWEGVLNGEYQIQVDPRDTSYIKVLSTDINLDWGES